MKTIGELELKNVWVYIPQNSGLRDQLGDWGWVRVTLEFAKANNLAWRKTL